MRKVGIENQTSDKATEIAESRFWATLRSKLEDWDIAFKGGP